MKRANGEGSIRKVVKNGKKYWEGRVSYNGKQRYVYGKKQTEVKEKLEELKRQISGGYYIPTTKQTVSEWLDEWLSNYCKVKERTHEEYESIINNHLKPAFNNVKLQKLTKKQIQDTINVIAKSTSKRTGKPLSPKTVKCINGVLHDALQAAVDLEILVKNPSDNIKLPVSQKANIKPFTPEEIKEFFSEAEGNRFYNLYRVTLFTGMREGEICGLSWDEVDFDNGIIYKKQQLQYINGEYKISTTKSSNERTIPMMQIVIDMLQSVKVEQDIKKAEAGEKWTNKYNLVFTDESGVYCRPQVVYKNFKSIVKKIGMPDKRFHDLRHTFATLCNMEGMDMNTLSEIMGHYAASFTQDRYTHSYSQLKIESAQKMNTFITEIGIA